MLRNTILRLSCFVAASSLLVSQLLIAGQPPVWRLETGINEMEIIRGSPETFADYGEGLVFPEGNGRAVAKDIPDFTKTGGVSVSLFFRCEELPTDRSEGVLGAGPLLSVEYDVLMRVYSNGTVYGGLRNGEKELIGIFSEKKIEVGAWHHLAIVFSSEEGLMRLYLDGSVVGAADKNVGRLAGLNSKTLVLGSDPDGTGFQGAIAGVRIYEYAMTQDELYESTKSKPKD